MRLLADGYLVDLPESLLHLLLERHLEHFHLLCVRGDKVDHNNLGTLMGRYSPHCWLLIKAVRKVNEIH